MARKGCVAPESSKPLFTIGHNLEMRKGRIEAFLSSSSCFCRPKILSCASSPFCLFSLTSPSFIDLSIRLASSSNDFIVSSPPLPVASDCSSDFSGDVVADFTSFSGVLEPNFAAFGLDSSVVGQAVAIWSFPPHVQHLLSPSNWCPKGHPLPLRQPESVR